VPFARYIDPEGASAAREEYVARLYGAFCESVARLGAARGRLLDYASLPASVWDQVAPHFGLALDEPTRRRMRESSGTYSKSPVGRATAYSDDSERKRASATVALLAAIDAYARPARARLEAMHAARRGPA
jgi:hypothetical protein